MKRWLAVCLAAGSLLWAAEGWCFGREGHQVICAVAYQLAAPAVREKIDALVRAIPESHRVAINGFLRRPATTAIDFADSCVWPDVVKRNDEYDATYEWHFINVPREDTEVAMDDCMVGCLLSAIDHHSLILRSPLGDWPRAQALMFLGHWLADIHQPLHVSFAEDRGGNDTKVHVPIPGEKEAESGCANLHQVWDFCIIEHTGLSEQAIEKEMLKAIRRDPDLAHAGRSPREWANESLGIARSPDSSYCIQKGNRCEAIPAPADAPRELRASYYADHWPLLERRMEQAAVRLASLLTQLLT